MNDTAFSILVMLFGCAFIVGGFTWVFFPEAWADFNLRLSKVEALMSRSEWRSKMVKPSARVVGGLFMAAGTVIVYECAVLLLSGR